MTDTTSWMKDAACKGKTEYFYGTFSERPTTLAKREALAKSICATCPCIDKCREYARENLELGIWGGETDEERFNAGYQTKLDISVRRRIRAREYKLKRHAELLSKIQLQREKRAKR